MRRNITVIVTALFAVTVLMSGISLAQGLKVAFVDFKSFAEVSKRAKGQQKRFLALVQKKRTELEKKRTELQRLNEELQRQGPMLKEATRNAKIKEIGMKKMEYELAEKEAQSSLQAAQRKQQEIFRKDIRKIIATIRAQKKYDIIYDSVALLSADDSLDITVEVAKRYDLAVKKPAPTGQKK